MTWLVLSLLLWFIQKVHEMEFPNILNIWACLNVWAWLIHIGHIGHAWWQNCWPHPTTCSRMSPCLHSIGALTSSMPSAPLPYLVGYHVADAFNCSAPSWFAGNLMVLMLLVQAFNNMYYATNQQVWYWYSESLKEKCSSRMLEYIIYHCQECQPQSLVQPTIIDKLFVE